MRVIPSRRARTVSGALLTAAGATGAAWILDSGRRERETRRVHRALVDCLLNVLNAGDPDTERHSRRVADLCTAMAGALRLPREEKATLRMAALLHDMGKIDDRFFDVVHSRRPLTPEQRARIEHHPHESAHILSPLEELHPGIRQIVSSHHECWDGSGYPCGLEGEDIPLPARVIALADAFDAITQHRKYREATPVPEALEVLRRGMGSQFDPRMVRLLDDPRLVEAWTAVVERGRAAEARDRDGDDGVTTEATVNVGRAAPFDQA